MPSHRHLLLGLTCVLAFTPLQAAPPDGTRSFLETHCYDCHDAEMKKGGLDLTELDFDLADARSFSDWATVLWRVESGEMPPAKKPQPAAAEKQAFLSALLAPLVEHERQRQAKEGRALLRRMSRTEYENALRDLLALPELRIAEMLPPEGSAHGFDKSGEALDFSPVHAERLMEVADLALRRAVAFSAKPLLHSKAK